MLAKQNMLISRFPLRVLFTSLGVISAYRSPLLVKTKRRLSSQWRKRRAPWLPKFSCWVPDVPFSTVQQLSECGHVCIIVHCLTCNSTTHTHTRAHWYGLRFPCTSCTWKIWLQSCSVWAVCVCFLYYKAQGITGYTSGSYTASGDVKDCSSVLLLASGESTRMTCRHYYREGATFHTQRHTASGIYTLHTHHRMKLKTALNIIDWLCLERMRIRRRLAIARVHVTRFWRQLWPQLVWYLEKGKDSHQIIWTTRSNDDANPNWSKKKKQQFTVVLFF